MIRIRVGSVKPEVIRSTIILLIRLDKLRKKNGIAYVCKYMKALSLYTMKYISSDKSATFYSYGLKVKLNKGGIPYIYPIYLRRLLRTKQG